MWIVGFHFFFGLPSGFLGGMICPKHLD